ncbi:MAG: nickel-dependent lactate racemase [Spirochaetia bacterium]
MTEQNIPYGKDSVTVRVPDSAHILSPAVQDPPVLRNEQIADALENPIGTPALSSLISNANPSTVAITISDITRAVPNKVFMPEILRVLRDSGISDDAVTIIVGTGMHRPSTPEEHEELLGPDIVSRYRVIDHKADDAEGLLRVSEDPYVAVNALFAEADFKIVTGFIEPHFMAGFSGGRKGVCPALVDLQTIQRFHGYETLSDPRAKEGVLNGNPCHEVSLDVARRVGVDFLFNVAINKNKEIVGVYCGELEAAHQAGCGDVAKWTGVKLEQTYDIVVTHGGGYPLDQNFYQTVKGMCLALPALHTDSKLLLVSACTQQLGSEEYTTLMKRYSRGRWRQFLADAAKRTDVTEKDQWELQLQTRVLERIGEENVLFFSDHMEQGLQEIANVRPILGEEPVENRLQQTLDELLAENPSASIAVIPGGPYTILEVASNVLH